MLILIICLVIALLSNKTKEGFWTYHTRGSTFPMERAYTNNCGIGGIRKMNGRCYDNYMRHFTQPRWIAKEEIVPAYTPYFDYERFYPSGVLTHTTKPTLTLTLFSEKNLSGGGVIFNYKYGIIHFSTGGVGGLSRGTTVPFQTNKDLNTNDVVRIPGYPGKFRVTIQERGVGVTDLPYPYTFQPNVV
jgi:hypothetical protein